MRTKASNRIISFMLALILALGMLPANAFAVNEGLGSKEAPKGVTTIWEEQQDLWLKVSDTANSAPSIVDVNGNTLGNWDLNYWSTTYNVSGHGYCGDHQKEGTRDPNAYRVQLTGQQNENVGSGLTMGVVASGYPQKATSWVASFHDSETGTPTDWIKKKVDKYNSECAAVGISPLSYPETYLFYINEAGETTSELQITDDEYAKATQLAVWHSLNNVRIEGAIESNQDYMQNAPEAVSLDTQVTNSAKRIVALAKTILWNAYNWERPIKVGGGMFFGGESQENNHVFNGHLSRTDNDVNNKETNKLESKGFSDKDRNKYTVEVDGQKTEKIATDGTIEDLYIEAQDIMASPGIHKNSNIYKQTLIHSDGSPEEFYVIYFNFYSETDCQGKNVTLSLESDIASEIGAFVTVVHPEYQDAEFYNRNNCRENLTGDFDMIQKSYGGATFEVPLVLIQYINSDGVDIGKGAEYDKDDPNGNGYRYWGVAKLCVPVEAYNIEAAQNEFNRLVTEENKKPNPSPVNYTAAPDFDLKVHFNAPYACQYEVFLATPENSKYQPVVLANPNTPVHGELEIKWNGIKFEGDPQPPVIESGGLIIYKYDQDSLQPLKGAVFQLECTDPDCSLYGASKGAVVNGKMTATTNDQGFAVFNFETCCRYFNEEEGHYPWKTVGVAPNTSLIHEHDWVKCTHAWKLTEIQTPPAPAGKEYKSYGLAYDIFYDDGSHNTQATAVKIANGIPDEDGEVVIRKVNSATNMLVAEPATFTVTNVTTGWHSDFQTSGGILKLQCSDPNNSNAANGYYIPYGSYMVREKRAPSGYELNDTQVEHFQLTQVGGGTEHYSFVFKNDPKKTITLRKVSGDDGSPISGVRFKYWFNDQYQGTTDATNSQGYLTVSNLETGWYKFQEATTKSGYIDNEEFYSVYVDCSASKSDYKIIVENYELRELLITKLDGDTNRGLSGAKFNIRSDDGSFNKNVSTGYDGTAVVTGLSWGTYTITETAAPTGHLLPTDGSNVQTITIAKELVEKHNSPIRLELPPFKNYQERSLLLTKLDAHSHQGVAGARFHIENDDGSFSKDVTTGANGTVTVTGLSWGTYTITETNPPKGYLLPTDGSNVKTVVIDYELVNKDHSPVIIEVEAFENHKEKTLIVTKVDAEMGWYLPDAEFKLTSMDGSISKTGVTGVDGRLTFTNLPFGTYQLEETKAPYGYDLPAEPVKTIVFDMNSPDTVEVTYEDHQQVDIILCKVDAATGKPLAGAEFELQDDDGNVVGRYITDSTGTATTERLEPGVYHAYEIKAPEGYALDPTPQWVKIDTENSSPKLLRFQDVPETSLLITKLDAQTDAPLMGAVFEVRDKDGNVIGRYTTGENGTVCTEPLNPQNYDVAEVIAPDGYALDKTEHPVTIVAGKANGIVIRDNQLATLTIYKADTDNKPIAGCTFKVETADGVFIGQYVTDSSGEAVISGINAGHYIITEVDPATGYVAVGTPKTITVRYGVKNRVEFTNAEYGGLLIKLVDQADGQWLPNGQFVVTHCADNNIVFTGTTDTAGTILVSNLIPGDKYIITQTFPPDGYTIIDSEKSEFVEAGMNKLVLFEDCTAGIVIEKVDKLTQDTLAGARFQLVRNSDNIVIGEYVTGTDGLAVASGLVPGMYTAREIEAPTNYYLDTEDKLVHVKAGTTAHVTFMDTPYSGITIKSVDDATNLPLAGTVFEVYMQNGNLVGSYTTDSTGTVQTLALEPGFYVIKQIFVQEGYSYDGGDRTVEVVNGVEVTETFRSVACGTLNIYATDNQNKGLPGMRGTVTKVNGEFVAEFVTGIDGMATLTGLSAGNYFVIEDKAPDGYQPSEEKQKTVTIKSNKPTSVYFTHAKTYGVQIKTTVLQTAKPIAGAKYRVTTPDGGIIGIYTSDEAGLIYATLDPGTYVITPVMAPDGYEFSTKTETHRTETVHGDADSRVVTVKADRYTVVEFVVTQLSSVRVKLIDGNTKAGIYGIRLLLKDSKGTIVGEYWTNNEGYITLSRDLVNGKYLLEQITVPSEYALDTVPKDITILNGETTEVIWTMWKTVGQIQVELHSLDYNPTLDLAAGTLLMGGEFEVVNADTYQVVATMTSDANGVAATAGLPIGRYFIRQTKAPAYYGLSDKETEVRLKVANDVVRVQYYDPSLYLGVFNSQKSNVNVTAGTVMRYDVLAVSNCSTVQLDNFYWTIKVPTDAARIGTLYTGTWNAAVWYTVSYKTNMADYKVFMKNLSSTANHQMDLSSTALGLQSGEYVTEVRFEFGSVPSGFCLTNNPAITMYVLPSVYNGYKIISRMEVGGKYIDAWVADTSLWTTTVKNLGGTGTANDPRLPDNLPKTGY